MTLHAATPGPWDCTDREQLMRLLREREATRNPAQSRDVDVRQIDDHTFVVRSTADGTTATRITVGDSGVVAMQQFIVDAGA